MRSVLTFIFLFCVWGCSFVAIKFSLGGMPPFAAAAARLGVALLGLTVAYPLLGKRFKIPVKSILPVYVAGLFMLGFPFAALFWAEQYISAGLAGVINGTLPIAMFILGLIFLPKLEPFSVARLVGLLVGLAGVVLIFFPVLSFTGDRGELMGSLAGFFMVLCYAIGSLSNRYILSRGEVDLHANLFHQHLVSFVFVLVLSLVCEASVELEWDKVFSTASVLSVLYLGLISTAVAFLIYYELIRKWGAVRTTTVTYFVPLVAIASDLLFFGNLPKSSELIGIMLVVSGVISIQWEALKRTKRVRSS